MLNNEEFNKMLVEVNVKDLCNVVRTRLTQIFRADYDIGEEEFFSIVHSNTEQISEYATASICFCYMIEHYLLGDIHRLVVLRE